MDSLDHPDSVDDNDLISVEITPEQRELLETVPALADEHGDDAAERFVVAARFLRSGLDGKAISELIKLSQALDTEHSLERDRTWLRVLVDGSAKVSGEGLNDGITDGTVVSDGSVTAKDSEVEILTETDKITVREAD